MKYLKKYEATHNWDHIKKMRLKQEEEDRKVNTAKQIVNKNLVDKLNDKYDFNFEIKKHNIQGDLDISICEGSLIQGITKEIYLVIDRINGDTFDCTLWFNHTEHLKDHFNLLAHRLAHVTHDEDIHNETVWVGRREVTSMFIKTSVDSFMDDIKSIINKLDSVLNKLIKERDRGNNLINSLDEIEAIFNDIKDHDKCHSFKMEHEGYNVTVDMNFDIPYKKSNKQGQDWEANDVLFEFDEEYDQYHLLLKDIKERIKIIDDFKLKGRIKLAKQELKLYITAEI